MKIKRLNNCKKRCTCATVNKPVRTFAWIFLSGFVSFTYIEKTHITLKFLWIEFSLVCFDKTFNVFPPQPLSVCIKTCIYIVVVNHSTPIDCQTKRKSALRPTNFTFPWQQSWKMWKHKKICPFFTQCLN